MQTHTHAYNKCEFRHQNEEDAEQDEEMQGCQDTTSKAKAVEDFDAENNADIEVRAGYWTD